MIFIVDSGGRGFPERIGYPGLTSYSGGSLPYYTVKPGDDFTEPLSVSTQKAPVARYPWQEPKSGEPGCETVYHDSVAFGDAWGLVGLDIHVAIDAECDTPDKFYAPNLYKSRNGLQAAIESASGGFVIPGMSYSTHKEINTFVPASLMRYCNYNYSTFSATAVLNAEGTECHATFAIVRPYAGASYKYDITDSSYDRRFGSGDSYSDTVTITLDKKYAGLGLKLTAAWGWTRYVPRMFMYAFGRTAFVPDIDPGEGLFPVPSAIDPANVKDFCCEDEEEPPVECCRDCFGVGRWIHRDKSNTYAETDTLDMLQNSGEAFVEGELARYMGNNWSDPGIFPQSQVDGEDLEMGYWRNFSVMKRTQSQDRIIEQSKRGQATDGSTWFLRDETKSWWGYPFGSGDGKVVSGTSTSGGAGSLTDSTITDIDNEERCYFNPDRFVGFNPYAGFVLEIDTGLDEYGATITKKVPITSASQDSGTISWPGYCGVTAGSGKAYRIREPSWNLNWWQERKLVITKKNGTRVETQITGNDNDTLFFSPLAQPVEDGDTYEIVELKLGGVYKRHSGQWVAPTGADARGSTFHKEVTENAPTEVIRFGRCRQHDGWKLRNEQELFTTIDALRWTRRGADSWRSCQDGVTPECSARYLQFAPSWQNDTDCSAFGASSICCATTFNEAVGVVRAYNTALCFVYGYDCQDGCRSPSIPHVEARAQVDSYSYRNASIQENGNIVGVVDTQSGYLQYSGVPTCIDCTVDIMLFATCPYPSPNGEEYDFSEEGIYIGGINTKQHTKATFNSYGVSVLNNQWSKLETQTPDANGSGISGKVGAVDLATTGSVQIEAPSYPPFLTSGSEAELVRSLVYSGDGFDIVNQCLICKWDFEYAT